MGYKGGPPTTHEETDRSLNGNGLVVVVGMPDSVSQESSDKGCSNQITSWPPGRDREHANNTDKDSDGNNNNNVFSHQLHTNLNGKVHGGIKL